MTRTTFLVLHGLRLRSLASAQDVAARYGLDRVEVDRELRSCRTAGWVTHREGRLSGWSLTTEGRREAIRQAERELDRSGHRDVVQGSYRRFLDLNGELLAICTDWQTVSRDGERTLNDHTDAAHDAAVLARLEDLHRSVLPVTDALAGALDRFAGYGDRLGTARDRLLAGDPDWLTKPVIDSYHTIWFELHEDLLATLGRERSDERPGAVTTEERT